MIEGDGVGREKNRERERNMERNRERNSGEIGEKESSVVLILCITLKQAMDLSIALKYKCSKTTTWRCLE